MWTLANLTNSKANIVFAKSFPDTSAQGAIRGCDDLQDDERGVRGVSIQFHCAIDPTDPHLTTGKALDAPVQ